MSDEVLIKYTGAQVILVDGKCYELAEVIAGPIDEGIIVEEEYDDCAACEAAGGIVGP
jgi:hypothetical protein